VLGLGAPGASIPQHRTAQKLDNVILSLSQGPETESQKTAGWWFSPALIAVWTLLIAAETKARSRPVRIRHLLPIQSSRWRRWLGG